MRHRTYDVLLVEPESDSVSRFTDSFETSETTNNITVVSTGDQALDYIDQHGDYTDAPRPDLVLLDHQAAAAADDLGALRVALELVGLALGAGAPLDVLGLPLGLRRTLAFDLLGRLTR